MANIKSQIKRIGTSEKARQRNAAKKSAVRTAAKKVRLAVQAKDLEAAKVAYAKGIIKGSASGNQIYLNPYNLLTRKEAAVMINNVLNLTNSTDALSYVDASSIPDWATQAVKNLTAYKIIQGNDSNEYELRIYIHDEALEWTGKHYHYKVVLNKG